MGAKLMHGTIDPRKIANDVIGNDIIANIGGPTIIIEAIAAATAPGAVIARSNNSMT